MFLSGQWGTLCNYGSSYTTIRVACRQLGYNYNANGNQCILTLIVNHIGCSMNSSTDVKSIFLLTGRDNFFLFYLSFVLSTRSSPFSDMRSGEIN